MKTPASNNNKTLSGSPPSIPEAPHPSPPPQRRSSRSWLRSLAGLTGGCLFLGAVYFLLIPAPLRVEVAYVERGSMRVTVNEEGRTRVKDRYIVSAPLTGRLQRIQWEPGDWVEAEELLAQIDPLPLDTSIQTRQAELQAWQAQQQGVETLRPKREAIHQAQARIEAAQAQLQAAAAQQSRAQANLQQAERETHRSRALEESGALSREQREQAELEETVRLQEWQVAQHQLRSAQAQVTMAEADLALLEAEQQDPDYLLQVYGARMAALEAELLRLQDDLDRTQIHSPITGQVLRVIEEDGRMVAAGTPLLELGNPQQSELVIDVLSQEALQIEPGDPVWVEQQPGQWILAAQITRVEPAAFTKVSALGVEEQRVNVIADWADQNPRPVPWGDGYRVDVQIGVWEESEVLKIPVSALFRCQSAWCVFRVESGIVRQQHIQVGPRNPREVVVLQGLTIDTPVILYPAEQVEDGRRVQIQ